VSDTDRPTAPEVQEDGAQVTPEASPDPVAPDGVTQAPEIDPLEIDIELLLKEREEYLELSRRVQADFENYKKRVLKQQTEHLERAAAAIV